jgi:hypothetical protein
MLQIVLLSWTMFYKIICLTFSGSSLPTFMDISWCWSKACCRLFYFHEPCFIKLFVWPFQVHHYQPLWTLVGGGIKHVADCSQLTSKVLPRKCEWIREAAAGFKPDKCIVTLSSGEEVQIDSRCLVISVIMYYLHLTEGVGYIIYTIYIHCRKI